jgi:hypothetical protein
MMKKHGSSAPLDVTVIVGFEVLTLVKISISWGIMPRSPLKGNFRRHMPLPSSGSKNKPSKELFFDPEDGGDMFL